MWRTPRLGYYRKAEGDYSMKAKKKLLGVAALCALACASASADWGLVDAQCGTGDFWPFRKVLSCDGGQGYALRANVPVVFPSEPIMVVNTQYGDPGDIRTFTSSDAWAPAAVYQIEVYGQSSTVIKGLVPGAIYRAEIHFAETYNANQNRIFRCQANGVTLVAGVRPATQGLGVAHAFSADVAADDNGAITFQLKNYADNGIFGGYAVWGTALPTWTEPTITGEGADVKITWRGARDVLRYYVQSSDVPTGPWSDEAVLMPEATGHTVPGGYNPHQEKYWRVVASNGVGVVTQQAKLGEASAIDYTDLATRGETIANNPAANYRVARAGEGDLNKLAGPTVEAAMYMNGHTTAHTLALGAGETLTVEQLGVLPGAGNLTVGDVVGQGQIKAKGPAFVASVEDANAMLTLNAPLKQAAAGGLLSKYGQGTAVLAGGTDVASITLGDGKVEVPYAADAELTTALAGKGTFVKGGAGKLSVKNANPNFDGTFEIKEGTVQAATDAMAAPFGDGKATIKVDAGATLDVGNPNAAGDNNVRFGATRIVFEGTGVDGQGALVNSTPRSQYNALVQGELSGDALINTAGRFDFRAANGVGSFALNGHTLTKRGGSSFYFTSVPVSAGTTDAKIRIEEGTFGLEASSRFSEDVKGTIELANNAAYDFYNLAAPITWPLHVDATGGKIACRSGNYDGNNTWSGDVQLDGTLETAANDGSSVRITGKISGPGGLKRTGGGNNAYVKIENAANDYTGVTEANYGILHFPTAAALPGYDQPNRVVISNTGRIGVHIDGWTAEQIDALTANAAAPADGRGAVQIDTAGRDLTLTADSTKAVGIGKTGEGTIMANGAYRAGGGLFVDQGTLVVSNNAQNVLGAMEVQKSGRLEVFESEVDVGLHDAYIASVGSDSHARVVVGRGGYIHAGPAPESHGSCNSIFLGHAQNSYGTLEVRDGGRVEDRIYMGNARWGQGSVLQSGGEIMNWGGWGRDGVIAQGEGAYGYWEVAGGVTSFGGYSQVAKDPRSSGMIAVKGDGVFQQLNVYDGPLALSRGGTGVVYVAGGKFTTAQHLYLGEPNDWDGTHGAGIFNMCGGSADIASYVQAAERANFWGQLNLVGGVFAAEDVRMSHSKENAKAYATFNGGAIKAKKDGAFFGSGDTALTGLYAYEGGLTVDSNGRGVGLGGPVAAPQGQGVKRIYWTRENLIGAPVVHINGDGFGATAVAEYDQASGKVTGVRVTCPGWGYTTKPTVTMYGGGIPAEKPETVPAEAVSMGPSVAGPIVKEGAGTLVLNGANAFVGVEVRGGALSALDATLPAGPLTLAGGTFRAVSYAATSVKVEGDAETVSTLAAPLTIGRGAASGDAPGLYGAFTAGDWNQTAEATAETAQFIATEFVYVDKAMGDGDTAFPGFPNKNVSCTYDGYIWNRGETDATWTFAEFFDDGVFLKIDDEVVISTGFWDSVSKGTVTVTPGAHKFHLSVNQGTGGSGPSNANSWMKETGLGIAVDWYGRNEEVAGNYVKLADPGDGSLFTLTANAGSAAPDFGPDAVVRLEGGTLVLGESQPGLAGGFVANGTYKTAACPMAGVYANLDYANTKYGQTDEVDGVTNANIDYVFEGFIWNHGTSDVTWTLMENFDDSVYLTIDGAVVLDDGAWDNPTHRNVTLAPGAHAIRIGLHQGTGGSGPSGQKWMTNPSLGIGIDLQGRDAEDAGFYQPLTAARGGGQPLLTTGAYLPGASLLPSDVPVAISGGATLDLNGGSQAFDTVYSAAGGIVNGGLKITNAWKIDLADVLAGNSLTAMSLDLTANPEITFTGDFATLPKGKHVLATTTHGITGQPEATNLPGNTWRVQVVGNTVVLTSTYSTVLYVR